MWKFPFIKQLDSMQCGIACVAMICKHLGKEYTLRFLSEYCTPGKDGVSIKGISDLCLTLGLDTVCGKVTINEIMECPLPAILHWNQNHFVVLYKIKDGKKFFISDPAKGKRVYNLQSFSTHFLSSHSNGVEKGVALFIEPNANFGHISDNSVNDKKSVSYLIDHMLQYKAYGLQIILSLLFSCLLQLIFPFLTQSIVDIGISTGNINFIWLVLAGELAIVLGKTLTDIVRNWLLLHISMRINISLVSDFFIKLFKLPMSYFDTKKIGDLFQRITDHDRIRNFLTSQILGMTFSVLSIIVFGTVLAVYDIRIFLIYLIATILYGIWMCVFLSKRKQLDYDLFEQQAANQNKTYQLISAMQEIKLQDCEERRRFEWEDTQADLFDVNMKVLKLQFRQESGSTFINEIKNIIITVTTATCVIGGEMTIGMMLAVQYIIGQLNSPIAQLVGFIYSLQDVKISLERINDIHHTHNEDSNSKHKSINTDNKSIRFDNVSFSYNQHSANKTLENISFTIPKGRVTAIVGTSGSGKTTILKLILGYYNISSGEILIGSESISKYNLKEWRKHCGVVMQDGYIFSESIARNIATRDGDIDNDRLIKAAKIANIHDFIMQLPLKYETIIGNEGIGISQGQKQRILIARAVYRNPEFIILDEATNALDAENERCIVENLRNFYRNKTAVIVAHRLSTVRNADNLIVIEKGKIVETGSHNELIKLKGHYHKLISNQLELGL